MITIEQLRKGMPFAKLSNVERFIGPINEAMEIFYIDTFNRQTAFLANLGHESGSLRYTKELASGEAYEGRKDLGNTEPGDGVRYKGRGPIQITGRANYKAFSDFMGLDFVSNPTMLEEPHHGSMAAGWFWDKKNLNKLADIGDLKSFYAITKKINGGLNGIDDRLQFWKQFKEALA